MNFRWTAAGRAALVSAAHVGTAAVSLTHLALGDGQGPGGDSDDNRTALRNERHRAAIEGTAATSGRIALRADFNPDAAYGITEAGIFGTAGDPPSASQMLLYWTDSGAEAAKAASGAALAIAALIEFQNAAAEVAVTVGGNIVFGATEPASEEAFGSTRYATGTETGDKARADRSVTPKGLHEGAGKVLATLLGSAPGDGTVYQLKGKADGTIVVEERTQDGASSAGIAANAAAITALAARVATLETKTGDASETKKGIVELATAAEAKAGTDGSKAVTPKSLKAASPAPAITALAARVATLETKTGDASETKKGIVELATAAEAKAGTDGGKAVTPKSLKAATDALPKGLADKVPAAAAADKHYVIKRAKSSSGGGLSIVEAVFRRYVTPGNHNLVVPAGVTRLRVLLVGAGGGGGGGGGAEGQGHDDDEYFGDRGRSGRAGGESAVLRGTSVLARAAGGAAGAGGAGSSTHPQGPRYDPSPGAGVLAPDGSRYGAGGGGGAPGSGDGGSPARDGEGGGAGSRTGQVIDVTPGETLRVKVGLAGTGGAGGDADNDSGGAGASGGNGFAQIING